MNKLEAIKLTRWLLHNLGHPDTLEEAKKWLHDYDPVIFEAPKPPDDQIRLMDIDKIYRDGAD